MSVVALTGIIRSGKSIEAVQIMINNLKRMRHVYTNVDGWDDMQYLRGVIGHVCEDTNEQEYDVLKRIHFLGPLDVRHFYDFVTHESSVICIDEAHDHMDSREWDAENRKSMNTWIKKSGKGGHELILVTQDVDELDKRIKTLIAWTYVFQKVDYLGNMVKNKFSCDQYRNTNIKKKPFKTFHRSYDPKLFPCYKSFAEDHIVENTAIARPNILNHWSIKVAVVAVVVMCYFVFYKSSLFSGDILNAKKMTTENQKRIALLSPSVPLKKHSVPVVIEYRDLMKLSPAASDSKKALTGVIPNIEVKAVVCNKVADIEFNDVNTVINDCGSYMEKYVNGELVWKDSKDRIHSSSVRDLPLKKLKNKEIKS